MRRRVSILCVMIIMYLAGLGTGYYFIEKPAKEVPATEAPAAEEKRGSSIFSWNKEYVYLEYADQVADVMERLNCDTIYQKISDKLSEKEVLAFLKRQARMGNKVWYLAGDKSWALDENAESMKAVVEDVIAWNRIAEEGCGFQGIVWDVEPYLLDEWDEDADACMEQYVENCKVTYELAKATGLQVLMCIPYHYDNRGMEEELEVLISSGCDGVAVMNYNKKDEVGQIETELKLAKKYDKQIINIVELQEPGKYDLEEINTYYNDGFAAVEESFKQLEEYYAYEKLGFSWHYLKTAIELMEEE